MGKRKAYIFTVVESVNNWFDASNHDLVGLEGPAALGNQPKISEETAVQTNGIEVAAASPRLIGVTAGEGSVGPAAEVAPPGGLEFGGGVTDPLYVEVDDFDWSTHEAFWRLL